MSKKKLDTEYNPKLVNKIILIIQRSSDEQKKKDNLLILFEMMKNVVTKNVTNFMTLSKNSELQEIYGVGDLRSESFIIMKKCVDNYKVNKNNNFYFYLNKSLSRNLYRRYEKELKKSALPLIDYEIEPTSVRVTNTFDDTELLFKSLNFTDIEKLVSISRMKYEKKDVFLQKNQNISSQQYYEAIKTIKEKLKHLKIEDDE